MGYSGSKPEAVRPGYRLQRLELTNWGTFDSTSGQVYSLPLNGRSALLVGQNGSGKSTLVDALLTLLVQPGVRNYNVAAGAKKRERDERTYIRGACGRSSDEELGSVTDYLRPGDKHYSALLAVFSREDTGEAFTLAQVLQITADGEVDKTYAFADSARSIVEDLSGLKRGERMRKQLAERGFRATTKYTEYLPWIARQTHLRPKAMDVFNQTVAVKDIQSLNRFIREHMLEAHPWRERIDGLLEHFSQLSQAHQALVRARRQIELLEPIKTAVEALGQLVIEQTACQQQVDAIDSYFRRKIVNWLQPRMQQHSRSIAQAGRAKQELQREIDALDDQQRALKNEIEKTGGDRLRQLPLLVETQQALLSAKKRERQRLQTALATLCIEAGFETRDAFEQLPNVLDSAREQLAKQSSEIAEQRLLRARQWNQIRAEIEDEQSQLRLLQQHPGNLPSWLAEVRQPMAKNLSLPESELAFACELISLAEDELEWQPAIEMVLRRFALTLLVPERHYRAVNHYVENNALTDRRGEGQRLVYVRVPESAPSNRDERSRRSHGIQGSHSSEGSSLVAKLKLRTDHRLHDWLMAELNRRFDYRCCESLDEFQRATGMAITVKRHVKYGNQQHEKDDRPQTVDARRFVLGWDNTGRMYDLHQSLAKLRDQAQKTEASISQMESDSKRLSKQLAAIETAGGIPDFDLIDIDRHQREIEQLESERDAIEHSNDSVRAVRQRLEETIERRFAAQRERDAQVAMESNLLRECDQAELTVERHEQVLAERQSDGSLAEHELVFGQLDESLYQSIESMTELSQFAELQQSHSKQIQQRLDRLRHQAEPLQADAVRSMQRFLSENPEERADLRADMLYADGFLGLLEQLQEEGLPRHEQRFRDRLNEKVIQEIGVFHAALQLEKHEILTKLDALNTSLKQLEYRPGTFMRLEPREVQDREIADFQELLRECLNDHFDGERSADESRFARIESLIHRLRDEERWRDKVTDVRRWFDFAARELDAIDGSERSCYEDSSGQSGGEKAKLAFTILVAAIAYQFDLDPHQPQADRLHFVVVDEMFSKVDDRYADYALQLFEKFSLQLLIVAPLDAKARVTEPYVGCYLHTVKNEATRTSDVFALTSHEYDQAVVRSKEVAATDRLTVPKPR